VSVRPSAGAARRRTTRRPAAGASLSLREPPQLVPVECPVAVLVAEQDQTVHPFGQVALGDPAGLASVKGEEPFNESFRSD
jgi:hypothetical protein